jgi:hypothetical protein
MNKEGLLDEFRKQCEHDLYEAKEKYTSQEFVKGVKRGLVAGELILRQLLREKDDFEKNNVQ